MPRSAPHSRWRALVALTPRQLTAAARIVAALVRVDRLLRRRPFNEVVDATRVRITFDGPTAPGPPTLPVWAKEDARLVERLGRMLLPGNPCLRTSLVIAQRLREFDPAVRIGVAGIDGRFSSAHAWVEVGGLTFGEDPRFEPFLAPPRD